MKVTAQMRYAADPEQAFAMLLDEDFQEEVCRATGSLGSEVAIDGTAAGATIRTTRQLPTDQFPDFVQKFVGDTVHVARVDTWGPAAADGSRDGTIVVEIKGAPVRLSGRLSLRPDGTGSLVDVDSDLKASVPLIGGKIEKAVEPPIRAAVRREEQVGARWLAR